MTARSTVAALRRVARERPRRDAGERCEMCAMPVDAGHRHVVNLESRALLCSCHACYLLFTDEDARQRHRAVPDRYLGFGALDATAWQELRIPVGLAFLFRNSAQDRAVAFYPGPAGATESELPPDAWDALTGLHPALATLRPDVEALLLRSRPGAGPQCFLVPVDVCYELAGRLRALWRGFDGGQEARAAIDAFFARVAERSRDARSEVPA